MIPGDLLSIFVKEGVALDDVLEMTDMDMKSLGIKAYKSRKRLLRVIEDIHASESTAGASNELPVVKSEALRASQGARAGSSTDMQLAEEAQRRLHLGDAQSGSR